MMKRHVCDVGLTNILCYGRIIIYLTILNRNRNVLEEICHGEETSGRNTGV